MTDTDLRLLVESDDLELGALSDEEHDALFFAEMIAVNPAARPTMEAAMRSLIAHELASIGPDGTVAYGGVADLVRAAVVAATAAFQMTGDIDGSPVHVTVRTLDDDVTLTERREYPGVRHYELGRARRIRRALVHQMMAGQPPGTQGAVQFEAPDDDARLAGLEADASSRLTISASRDFGGDTRVVFACRVLRDSSGQVWVMTRGESGPDTTLAAPYTAEELTALLTAWIGPVPAAARDAEIALS